MGSTPRTWATARWVGPSSPTRRPSPTWVPETRQWACCGVVLFGDSLGLRLLLRDQREAPLTGNAIDDVFHIPVERLAVEPLPQLVSGGQTGQPSEAVVAETRTLREVLQHAFAVRVHPHLGEPRLVA